jgi:gliding motility-associated-like protein
MYSYSWTPGNQTTPTAINLGANTYTVNVKDINNCSITKTVTLTQPTQLVATTSITSNYNGQNISCSGLSDGSAEVIASGATLPYSYNWSSNPAQTTYSASNLSAGTYSVIVKDVNNCAITKTVNLAQPLTIVATASVISNYNGQQLTCYGASNGSASVTVSNGTGPYTYSWSTIPTQTTTTATGLGAGNYSVTITDANGCNITKTLTLNQPSQLTATTSITSNYNGQNISCYGLTDGSASVTVSGATGPYTYSWSTVSTQTTATALNLGAGNYSVLVTDANGCFVTKTVSLSQPNLLQTILTNTSNYNGYNISCFGNNNGSIDISVNGGTGAYTYTWSNNAQTQDINNLSAGVYTVITHDLNGCSSTLFVNLTQPNKLIAAIDSLSHFNEYNLSCNGSVNGVIYVSVTGGVSNYNYLWSNGATTQSLYNVGAGYYYLSVTDLNNCNASVDTTLFQPTLLTNSFVVTSPLCNGVSNGSVNLIVNGGVSPLTYNWSNGFITEDLSNIGAGTYSVIIRDANGCKDTTVVIVTQPKTISLEKDVDNIKCYGDSTANINIQLAGGTPPYKYSWYDNADPQSAFFPIHTQNLISVTSGTYVLIVTDANGCILNDTTIITEPKPLQLTLYSPLYTGGYNISTYNGNDGSIDLTVSGGVTPYQYIWSNGATTEDVYNLTAYFPNPFPYNVIVTDSNGCRAFAQLELNQPMILEMPTGYSPNNDSKNDWFVVHGIEAYPDNELVIYNRWGNIVYNKTAYNNEWNGESNNGEKLPDATYFAILEINKGTIVLKGYVELRR